jgi:hypothetical protein
MAVTENKNRNVLLKWQPIAWRWGKRELLQRSVPKRHGTLQQGRISKFTRVWQELEYRIDVCRVSRGAHIWTSLVVKKVCQCCCGCKQFHEGRSFGFLVINVCNHGEHYETPRILMILLDTVIKPQEWLNFSGIIGNIGRIQIRIKRPTKSGTLFWNESYSIITLDKSIGLQDFSGSRIF